MCVFFPHYWQCLVLSLLFCRMSNTVFSIILSFLKPQNITTHRFVYTFQTMLADAGAVVPKNNLLKIFYKKKLKIKSVNKKMCFGLIVEQCCHLAWCIYCIRIYSVTNIFLLRSYNKVVRFHIYSLKKKTGIFCHELWIIRGSVMF